MSERNNAPSSHLECMFLESTHSAGYEFEDDWGSLRVWLQPVYTHGIQA